jgi:predicted porin
MKAIKFSVAAVAALAVSAFAADGDVLKPYGQISGEVGLYQIEGADGQGIDVRSYSSRFGLTGAHALDGGLTAVYQVEVGYNTVKGQPVSDDKLTSIAVKSLAEAMNVSESAVEAVLTANNVSIKGSRTADDGVLGGGQSDADTIANRNSYVGVAGAFGTFLIGNHDTPYKLAARGSGAGISNADTVGELGLQTDRRLNGAVAYIAPVEAATIVAAIVPAHTADEKGDPRNDFSYSLGVVVPVDIVTIGAGLEIANVGVDGVKGQVTETSYFAGVNAKIGDQFTVGVAYEGVSDSGKLETSGIGIAGVPDIKPKGKYSTILVPFTASLGDGLYTNVGIRYTTVDKKGAPVAAGKYIVAPADENQIDLGLTFGKKWGKDLDAYVGLKYVKSSEKTSTLGTNSSGAPATDSGFDFAVGLKVAFN